MSKKALRAIEACDVDSKVIKRAQHEAFDYSITEKANVRVRNCSHDDPNEHEYVVFVESEIPFDCDCPAAQYHEGPCKHQVAVAINEPVLAACEAAQNEREVGQCECDDLGELPCWNCIESGRKTLDSEAKTGGSE